MKWVEWQMAEIDRWLALAMSGNFAAMNAEITRQLIFGAAIWLLGWMLFFWLLYLVVKAAVRDGINESRMGDRWKQAVQKASSQWHDTTVTADLPPMHADK